MRQSFKIIAVGNTAYNPPVEAKISIRGKGRRSALGFVSKSAAICGCCGCKIAVGEQYFFLDFPCCLGCAKYETYEKNLY